MKSIAAIQLDPKSNLIVDEIDIPDPVKTQVQVKLISSGICHSQLHHMHDAKLTRPLSLGHEAVGVVTKVGPDSTYVKEGDHVIVTWVSRIQRTGRYLPTIEGVSYKEKPVNVRIVFTWAETIICEDEFLVKIDSKDSSPEASIVGCAVLTGAGAVKNTAKVQEGDTVTVFGAGGVGLSAIAMASILKASKIIVVDLDNEKLEFSKKFGATHTVNAKENNAVEEILDISNGGVDYAFDAIGVKVTMEQILSATKGGGSGAENHGGMAVLIGMPATNKIDINPELFMYHQKIYRGSLGATYPEKDFPYFLDLYRQGKFPIDKLVTTSFKLDDINDACNKLDSGQIAGRAIIKY